MDKHFADRQKPWRLGKVLQSKFSHASPSPHLLPNIAQSHVDEYVAGGDRYCGDVCEAQGLEATTTLKALGIGCQQRRAL